MEDLPEELLHDAKHTPTRKTKARPSRDEEQKKKVKEDSESDEQEENSDSEASSDGEVAPSATATDALIAKKRKFSPSADDKPVTKKAKYLTHREIKKFLGNTLVKAAKAKVDRISAGEKSGEDPFSSIDEELRQKLYRFTSMLISYAPIGQLKHNTVTSLNNLPRDVDERRPFENKDIADYVQVAYWLYHDIFGIPHHDDLKKKGESRKSAISPFLL